METKKWRNPYAPLSKKSAQPAPTRVNVAKATIAPSAPLRKLVPIDVRASVSRMRHNIKGISTTIRQMEETMDTLYGAMEIVQSFGRSRKTETEADQPRPSRRENQAARKQAVEQTETGEEGDDSGLNLGNLLSNLDLGQILSLLQSPLIQNLIKQNLGNLGGTKPVSAKVKRKKEG